MSMTAVIDLGADREIPGEPEPGPIQPSRGVLVLAALVLLAALGGAAPARYALTGLFSVPTDVTSVYAIYGDTLYVSRTGEVAAYQLPTGTRKWSAPSARPVGALVPGPGVVLAQFDSADVDAGVFAVDARTGRVLWRDGRARLLGSLAGSSRALLLRVDEVRGVDVPTGRTIWERPRGLGVAWDLPDVDPLQSAPPRLAFDGGDGVTEVVDTASGAVVSRAALESTWPATDRIVGMTASGYLLSARSVVDNQFFVARQQAGGVVLDAFDLRTLVHQWRTTAEEGTFFVTGCGVLLCANGFGSVSGLDRHTGEVRWTSHRWREARALPGGRLLMSNAVTDVPATVVEADTLRPVLPLAGWSPVAGPAGRRWLVGRDGPGLATWFGVVQPAGPQVRPLGRVSGVQLPQCRAGGGYLACSTVHRDVQVWAWHE